jgi:hypothetical protein
MSILVGSQALKHWLNINRVPKDIDYFSKDPIEGAETFWHPDLSKWNWNGIATLDELYTIKVSHSFWSLRNGSWEKHMWDINFMQENGATLIPALYDILYPIWEERYEKKKVNLNASPEDFFTSSVHRIYDHDSIHKSVAYYDEPLFNSVLKDGHSVMVDWNKFDALEYEDKVRLVREEVYATALERIMIPKNYKHPSMSAYSWALKKTITSFWKGRWALWVVLNYKAVRKPDIDYVELHKSRKEVLILL